MLRVNLFGIFLLVAFSVVFTTQLQSCSESSEELASRMPAGGEEHAFALSQEAISLSDETEYFDVSGVCLKKTDNQAEIKWALQGLDGKTISEGSGACEAGLYSARINGVQKIDCQKEYWLRTMSKSQSALFETHIEVSKNCPPESRLPAVSREGKACFFEARKFVSGILCIKACYQKGVVESQKVTEKKYCGLKE